MISVVNCGILFLLIFASCKSLTIPLGEDITTGYKIIGKTKGGHKFQMGWEDFAKQNSPRLLVLSENFANIKITTTRNTYYKFKLKRIEVTENELVYLSDEENRLIIPSGNIAFIQINNFNTRIKVAAISSIPYKNKIIDQYQIDYFAMGLADAKEYYHGANFGKGFLSAVSFYGWVAIPIMLATKPKFKNIIKHNNRHLNPHTSLLLSNFEYYDGYRKEAYRKKVRKTTLGVLSVIPVVAVVAVISILSFFK